MPVSEIKASVKINSDELEKKIQKVLKRKKQFEKAIQKLNDFEFKLTKCEVKRGSD